MKGTLVNLNAFYPLFMGHKDVMEWQVEICKRNNDPLDIDIVNLYVTPQKGVDFNKLTKDLRQQTLRETELQPNAVIQCDLNDLLSRMGMESELKEKRIVDNPLCSDVPCFLPCLPSAILRRYGVEHVHPSK